MRVTLSTVLPNIHTLRLVDMRSAKMVTSGTLVRAVSRARARDAAASSIFCRAVCGRLPLQGAAGSPLMGVCASMHASS